MDDVYGREVISASCGTFINKASSVQHSLISIRVEDLLNLDKIISETRMHSSRMRTSRLLTVYRSIRRGRVM